MVHIILAHTNRYADDFVIGVIGSKKDAEEIKEDVKIFLQEKLHLEMSEEKTKVTHSSKPVRYLGYDFKVIHSKNMKRCKNGDMKRVWYGKVFLYMPKEKWIKKAMERGAIQVKRNNDTGKEMWRPMPRKDLMNRNDTEIVSTFNAEIRGLYNFYRIAENVGALHKYYYMVRYSMLKTLAAKHRTNVSVIKKRHMVNGVLRIPYDTTKGRKYCEFYHDGFRKHSDGYDNVADVMPSYRKYDSRHTIVNRILKLVNTLIANTKGSGEKSGEDFWVKAERLLYCALIGYIHYEAPDAERNFTTLLEMINASEAREDDSEFQSPVDLMFERLEEKDPEHFAVKQYKKFLLSAGKTRSSILISCGARLVPFDIRELRELMESDELELDTLGDRKTALFIITSDTDPTFDFVTAMIVSQLFNLLCTKADDEYGGRLPVHVRCLLDEVANITIPNLERLISVLRRREISACLVVQAQSQLKAIYKEHADTIIGNCDTTLFLGGKEKTTLKEISEVLGKETIDSFNTSENRGRDVSHGLNYQKLGKELMSQGEIAVMDGGKCILQLRGVRPFFSDKYDITRHPKYKYLSDYDKKNTFDIEKFLKRQRRPVIIKPDTVFDYYEIDAADLQEITE